MRRFFLSLIAAVALSGGLAAATSATPPAKVDGVPQFGNVFVIIGENYNYSQVTKNNSPYLIETVKPESAWLTNYWATTHYSESNYVAMTSGQFTPCEQADGSIASCHQDVPNLFNQLDTQYAARVGIRVLATVGMVITMVGMFLLTRIPVEGTYVVDVLPPILLTSLGMGAVFVPLTLLATMGLDDRDQGLASGLFNTSQQIGGALGLAILATVAAGRTNAVGGPTSPEALVHGFRWAFGGSAVFIGGGIVVMSALLRKQHLRPVEAEAAAEAVS